MKGNFIKISILVLIVFNIISCKSLGEAVAFGIDSDSETVIREVVAFFYGYQESGDLQYLEQAEKHINSLRRKSKNNKVFEAKIAGADGELSFYRKDNRLTERYLRDVRRLNEREEWFYYLKALLTDDLAGRKNIINEGILKCSSSERLTLLLADLYFELGNYAEAVSLYDSVFFKSAVHSQNHKNKRDVSFFLAGYKIKSAITGNLMLKDKITAAEFIEITKNESLLLDDYIKGRRVTENDLRSLFNAGLLFTSNNNFITKKYLAFFFYNILNKADTTSLNKERGFEQTGSIKDVRAGSVFYRPVVFVTEWDIIELEDGLNFMPDKELGGVECFIALKKAEKVKGYF
jgi:hypothetical protein